MLVLETVVRIRREYAGGKAIKAIARDLHVSRKVIRKAIRAPEGAFDYQRKVQPLPRIGPFQDRLNTLLEENRSEEHTSELQSLMRISYAVFCLKKKNKSKNPKTTKQTKRY